MTEFLWTSAYCPHGIDLRIYANCLVCLPLDELAPEPERLGPPPPRPPTAIGMADDRFDELFVFIDTLPVADLRRLVNRLRRDVPPWAWR